MPQVALQIRASGLIIDKTRFARVVGVLAFRAGEVILSFRVLISRSLV